MSVLRVISANGTSPAKTQMLLDTISMEAVSAYEGTYVIIHVEQTNGAERYFV